MDGRAAVGRSGEDATADRYRSQGYRILARNWRCRLGELDLVLQHGDHLVFCEVKTRRGADLGGGYEAVHARKRAKLRALAETFCAQRGGAHESIRFDVASVALARDGSVDVQVFEDAF